MQGVKGLQCLPALVGRNSGQDEDLGLGLQTVEPSQDLLSCHLMVRWGDESRASATRGRLGQGDNASDGG